MTLVGRELMDRVSNFAPPCWGTVKKCALEYDARDRNAIQALRLGLANGKIDTVLQRVSWVLEESPNPGVEIKRRICDPGERERLTAAVLKWAIDDPAPRGEQRACEPCTGGEVAR